MGASGLGIDFSQNRADAVVDAKGLTTNQFTPGKQTLSVVTEIYNNVVASHFLHSTGEEFSFSTTILIDNLRPLSVSYALHNHLLGGLRCNTTEINVLDRLLMVIARLQRGVHLCCLLGRKLSSQKRQFTIRHHQPTSSGHVIARFTIDDDLNIGLFVVPLFRRGGQRQFNRFENNVFRNAFFR